jgi:AraC-like DNA-binding protein
MSFAVSFLKRNKTQLRGSNIIQKNWEWLLKFSNVFIGIIILNLILQGLVSLFPQYDGKIYSMILISNSIYIYWVGFESLTKSNFLFNTFTIKNQNSDTIKTPSSFVKKLEHYIEVEEVFTNKNLKIVDLAVLLGTTEKELSLHIHESFKMSFSEYINQQRIEKVKKLLKTEDQKKYTLLAIAEHAGFSSKSSFNAVFKKITGLTPTQFKATHIN